MGWWSAQFKDFTKVFVVAGRARQHPQQCEGYHKERDHRSGSDGFSECRVDRDLVLCLPRLAVLVSIEADRPGLGFQVHWVHIKLGSSASSLVGTLNG